PQRIRVSWSSIVLSSLSSLRTSPRTPASATRRFDPDPTTPTSSPRPSAQPRRRSSPPSEPGRGNSSAAPPVRIVVRRDSGESRWTPSGGSATPRRLKGAPAGEQRAPQRIDVARAHHQAQVPLAEGLDQERAGV